MHRPYLLATAGLDGSARVYDVTSHLEVSKCTHDVSGSKYTSLNFLRDQIPNSLVLFLLLLFLFLVLVFVLALFVCSYSLVVLVVYVWVTEGKRDR